MAVSLRSGRYSHLRRISNLLTLPVSVAHKAIYITGPMSHMYARTASRSGIKIFDGDDSTYRRSISNRSLSHRLKQILLIWTLFQ